MPIIKTDKYVFVRSVNNYKQTFKINRYADYQKGDLVAINYGNVARIKRFNNQSNVIGKAVSVKNEL